MQNIVSQNNERGHSDHLKSGLYRNRPGKTVIDPDAVDVLY